jgi:hypothetical protein
LGTEGVKDFSDHVDIRRGDGKCCFKGQVVRKAMKRVTGGNMVRRSCPLPPSRGREGMFSDFLV